ncbi:MAG: His/Gly/Thr/Pro-type tRNA ligase C-terminal domain-containing protein, partial [Candidatus Bathyarchaeia archaeon]
RIVEDQLRSRGYRVKLDSDPEVTPGAKFYFWEFRGVPLRIEVGLKEMVNRSVTICRRDTFERIEVDLEKLQSTIEDLARMILENLRSRAERDLESRIVEASSIEEVGEAVSKGTVARAPFCSIDYDGESCGEKLKEIYSAEVRGVRIDIEEKPPEKATCIVCGRPAKHYVYIGKSY